TGTAEMPTPRGAAHAMPAEAGLPDDVGDPEPERGVGLLLQPAVKTGAARDLGCGERLGGVPLSFDREVRAVPGGLRPRLKGGVDELVDRPGLGDSEMR